MEGVVIEGGSSEREGVVRECVVRERWAVREGVVKGSCENRRVVKEWVVRGGVGSERQVVRERG